MQFVVWNGNSETRTEHLQLIFIQLLLLVRNVLAFASFAQAVALDGFGQDDCGRAFVVDRGPVRGMNLDGIVPAQPHARQLLVRKMLHHFQQTRVRTEQVLAEVGSALNKILLILAVADFSQTLHQQAVAVAANQAVPIRAPDAFDDVPSRAAEDGF